MEHFLQPRTSAYTIPRVPYVADQRYDGLPFLQYAQRRKVTFVNYPSPDYHPVPVRGRSTRPCPDPQEQAAFFQTWLVFGLLLECFGEEVSLSDFEEDEDNEKVKQRKADLDELYQVFRYEEDGKSFLTTECLLPLVQGAIKEFQDQQVDIEQKRKRMRHLSYCIQYASQVHLGAVETFNPLIKLSIGGIGEILMNFVGHCASDLKIDKDDLSIDKGPWGLWAKYFWDDEVRQGMAGLGWCPSEIEKCANTINSAHMAYFISRINKSLPERDHTACTRQRCTAGQIDMKSYAVQHTEEGCECKLLTVDNTPVIDILRKEDLVPVLKISGGDKDINNLKIEVVESAPEAKYIAISHVWADGMGNPTSNSLYRCQLARLRNWVKAIPGIAPEHKSDGADNNEDYSVLVWLDTLCCPIGPPEAKAISLQKIKNVYKGAAGVLVLDSSLRPYPVGAMSAFEAMARIFNSSWMRRLWTLQEAALAKALVFQFDKVIAINHIYAQVMEIWTTAIWYRGPVSTITNEMSFLRSFFYHEDYQRPQVDLSILDSALKHRSVTVASDEPLCIGTLMSLDMSVITSVAEQSRMGQVWDLLIKSTCGVPSGIIFLPEARLDTPGLRWAPRSLLGFAQRDGGQGGRSQDWKTRRAEAQTPFGLRVRFPGFRLHPPVYHDGLPRDPFAGSLRTRDGTAQSLLEDFIYFRTPDNSLFKFFRADAEYECRIEGNDDERAWRIGMTHPLHDLASTGRCALLLRNIPTSKKTPDGKSLGLIVKMVEALTDGHVSPTDEKIDNLKEVAVRSEGLVIAAGCGPEETLVVTTIEQIAMQVRKHELTRKMCEIGDAENEEYKQIMGTLKQEMQSLMKNAQNSDPKLVDAINYMYPKGFLDDVWKKIANWYRQETFLAQRLKDDQVWLVD
ncbi:hypothetical protein BP6252_02903 [Coleophoma cylindrospora]|uniref:Heterokaryon incompatibility domain-containing protein n=1 Tax=Coleophoma cylindrospora TaxID=1849047 RepID=A0A3D8SGB5_9HELO|nr:hypothetical protein BP6252_02903 [Coleophoma cylindrospora]